MEKSSASSEQLFTISHIKAVENEEPLPVRTIPDCLQHYATVSPERNAVVFCSPTSSGPRYVVTYGDLYEKSCQVARSLIALGLRKEECVAVNMRPCPEWLYLVFGSVIAGARVALVSFTFKDGRDVVALMKQMQTCALLALDPGDDNEKWNIVSRFFDEYTEDGRVRSSQMPYLRYLIGHNFPAEIKATRMVKDLLTESYQDIELPTIDPDNITLMFQTSGSTGLRKLVAHTHKSSLYVRKLSAVPFFAYDDILYNNRPFYWISGFPFQLLCGQRIVTLYGYGDAPANPMMRSIEIIMAERATTALMLPSAIVELSRIQDALPDDWCLDSITTGGQPLKSIITNGMGKTSRQIVCGYGSTEFIFMCGKPIYHRNEFTQSVGPPVRGGGSELKIVDDDGAIVPVKTRGEIYVRCPGMFKEYLHDSEKTAKALVGDGWFRTDDLAWMQENGEVHVEGRRSNLIIRGGCNVAPEVLEQMIENCPGVEQVVIVPVEDEVHYQEICACVIRKEGCNVNEYDLKKYCETDLSDKKREYTYLPKFYWFMDSFPLTPTGKLSRPELVRMANERFKHC